MKLRELFINEMLDDEEKMPDDLYKVVHNRTGGTVRKNIDGDLYTVSSFKVKSVANLILRLKQGMTAELQWNFALALGNFNVEDCDLISFKNFPDTVRGDVKCYNNKITSFEGVPREIDGVLDLIRNPIASFSGIYKHINKVGRIMIPVNCQSSTLGLLKIKDLGMVSSDASDKNHPDYDKLSKMISIINNHNKGNRDILACQEELIEAGLKEYARL